jgi:diaminobutyrate-2-oxoglutarate transaminase
MTAEFEAERSRARVSGTGYRNVFEERESNVRSYCRAFPAIFTTAKGSRVNDDHGHSYIDFLAGAGALNYGHNNETIKRALVDYILEDGLTHGLDLHTQAKARFLRCLEVEVLEPRGLDYRVQFTGPTGANAVEAALKVARRATGRDGVFSFMGGYHGHSLGALAATANRAHRAGAGTSLPGVTFFPYPAPNAPFDTLNYIASVLHDTHSGIDLPAAIIVETVQAEGGVVVAPIEWLQRLRALCDDYGIILIVDEVQTGCGRTGPFFSFERAGIVPDVVTVSKSISGYGLPMALTFIRPEFDLLEPGEHTGTFRGNQLAFVAGAVALELYNSERIEARVATQGRLIAGTLDRTILSLDARLESRGLGMIWGVDTAGIDPSGALAETISKQCFTDGLILERVGRSDTVLKILPPLTIETAELEAGLSILATAFRSSFSN